MEGGRADAKEDRCGFEINEFTQLAYEGGRWIPGLVGRRHSCAACPNNYLSAFAQPALNKTVFTLVGYGTEVRKPDSGPQKPTPQSYPLLRRVTTSQVEAHRPTGADERQPQ